jgi:predicted CXXCH cytochrome family protein
MHVRLAPLLAACALAIAPSARAGGGPLAPVPREQALSTHSPFEVGACETCHERRDPASPGAVVAVSNDLCFDCHDEFKGSAPVRMERAVHPDARAECTACHNPHNSAKKKLRL